MSIYIRESWITSNINFNFNVEYPWYVLFAFIIRTIWKGRNDEVFNGKKFDPISIVYQSRKTANEIYSAFDFSKIYLKSISPTVKLVKWNFPKVGKIKLNTDGSFIAGQNKASFGGVSRDGLGRWMLGYNGRIGCMKINGAEILSICKGLVIAKENNWNNLIVEGSRDGTSYGSCD